MTVTDQSIIEEFFDLLLNLSFYAVVNNDRVLNSQAPHQGVMEWHDHNFELVVVAQDH